MRLNKNVSKIVGPVKEGFFEIELKKIIKFFKKKKKSKGNKGEKKR